MMYPGLHAPPQAITGRSSAPPLLSAPRTIRNLTRSIELSLSVPSERNAPSQYMHARSSAYAPCTIKRYFKCVYGAQHVSSAYRGG
jgi:hypothetical protein